MTDSQLRLPNAPLDRPLRICVVTQEDPFYIPFFFREFFAGEPENQGSAAARKPAVVLGVMIQPALGTKGPRDLAGRIWSLYGAAGFVRMGFRYFLAKLRSRLHRGLFGIRLWPGDHSVAFYVQRAGVPLLAFPPEPSNNGRGRPVANNVNGASFVRWVRSNEIDLIVSVSASQIFRETILGAPCIGCINLHNAPLPHYRGMLPNFRQMAAGERESVLTIHAMVLDLDRGDILLQRGTPIAPGMSLHDLMVRSKVNSASALWDALRFIRDGEAGLTPLSDEEGSYFTWPTRAEAKAFRRAGKRLL